MTLSERGWKCGKGTYRSSLEKYASAKTKDMQPYDGTDKGYSCQG